MIKARRFVFKKHFDGMPKNSDFEIVEEELRPIKDGEFVAEAKFLSVDPYMRIYSAMKPTGTTMFGTQVAKIVQSKDLRFPVGNYVLGNYGWASHTISHAEDTGGDLGSPPYLLPELTGHPMSLYLGILGMPGNTALFGFMDCCNPIAGETVVVTGAAGAVGSHVGQIAKIKGCTVIGIAGSDAKGEWLKSIGFDDYINYKTVGNLKIALKEKAPRGIDCYFDNVGGEISSIIIDQMNTDGRVAVCGSISAYNSDFSNKPKATILQPAIVMKQLTIKGLHASRYKNRWMQGIKQNREWLESGKLLYQETVTDGFDNMANALISILQGDNTGKAIVKV